jgi:hypothetical protein
MILRVGGGDSVEVGYSFINFGFPLFDPNFFGN